MKKLLSISLMALAFASCNNSDESKIDESAQSAPTTTTTLAPVPGSGPAGSINTMPAATSPINSNATAGLNPAHGAPGHRCDIPVGSPLNSPAGANPPSPAPSNPAPFVMNPQTLPPANNNVRLNPAHGAPGHDCSIPVGQPLKS